METYFDIYLDSIVFQIQKFGGASTYWKELLVNFIKQNNVNLIIQSADAENLNNDGQEILNSLDKKKIKVLIEDRLPVSVLRYLPLTKRLPAKSLYHNSYYRTCFQKSVVNIFTVHDFTHKRGLASKFPRKLIHIGLTAIGLKNADGIICISESTKRDLLHYYPNISEDKIKVIYHGVSDVFYPLQKQGSRLFKNQLNLDKTYVLFVGKREGYKKFDIIPEALKNMPHLKLVMVGGGEFSPAERLALDTHLPGRYCKLTGINNTELNELYNNAHCLLYTSLYEGFGIPLLEAMRAGCPVITNNLSSLGEVAGDAALIINDITPAAVAEKLSELEDVTLRSILISKGLQRSKQFSWDKCFNETFSFYKEVYNKKFN